MKDHDASRRPDLLFRRVSSRPFRKRFDSRSKSRLVSAACSAVSIVAAAFSMSSLAFFLTSAPASMPGESRFENRGFVTGFLNDELKV
jgi:hypothetical protein